MVEEVEKKEKWIVRMGSGKDMDRNFGRVRYVGYGDDFVMGVMGRKKECERMKGEMRKFMEEKLRVEM